MTDFTDVVEGASLHLTVDQTEAVRAFIFNDLSGSPAARCREAVERPATPRIGDAHPEVPGIVCLDINCRALDTKSAEVTVSYGIPQALDLPPDETAPGTTEVGASVQATTTQRDVNGDVLLVEWAPNVTSVNDITPSLPLKKQGGRVDIQIPQPVMRLTRRESQAPWEKSLDYVGKVNSLPWNTGAVRTWLCVNISGTTSDGGITYDVSYEFQYNPETWDATVVFIDPETSKPPGDVEAQLAVGVNTIKTYIVYPDKNFGPLGVNF